MKSSITIAKIFCIIFLLFPESIICQLHYLDKYPGIPIIAFTNITTDSMAAYPTRLQRLKELGVMGIYAHDVKPLVYNVVKDSGIKIFPFQASMPYLNNWVVYYTNGVYTKWQAEGKGDGSNGDVELKYNSDIGEDLFENGILKGIKTTSSESGNLIYGPWYSQSPIYKFLPLVDSSGIGYSDDYTIYYTANYRLKIHPKSSFPPGYLDSAVCTIKITDQGINPEDIYTHYDTTLTVRDFINSFWGNGWDQWSIFSKVNYTIKDTFVNNYWNTWMQYKIDWAGRTFLDLYVDYIEISDLKGRELRTDPNKAILITNLVNDYTDTSEVLGWFGLNEPPSIDNAEPFRIVDSLIQSVNGNLHLFTTFYTYLGGCFGQLWTQNFPGNGQINRGIEFLERSKLPFLSFNNYMYNDPWLPSESINWPYAPDYYLRNINEVAINNLHKFDSAGVEFSYSTQTGTWFIYDSICNNTYYRFYVPSPGQMLYHINLGLLYCMRELTCDPFFSVNVEAGWPCAGQPYAIGMVNGYDPYELTELGHTWKDTVAPRMSGLLGKTSRKLTTSSQHLNINPSVAGDLNLNCIKKVRLDYGQNPAMPSWIDLGFFNRQTESEANYFMIVNRYYSDSWLNEFIIDFRNLTGYKNWNLRNYVDSSEVTMLPDVNGYVSSPTYTINSGDGILLSASPVVLYGGTLLADEPAGEGQILSRDMTIDNGAVLTVYGTYTAKGDITIKDGSIEYGESALGPSEIIFENGHKLIIDSTATIQGTASNKLTLEFQRENEEENGVEIKSGGSLIISYCNIQDGETGITAELNADYLSARYIDFTGCINSSITIVGQSGGGMSS